MSARYNANALCSNGGVPSRIIGGKMPVPQPTNCKNHCPYGYGKAFCFPCMKKILGQDVEPPKEEANPEEGNA